MLVPPTGPVGPVNKTRLSLAVAPKLDPLKVTVVPAPPNCGEILLMIGFEFVLDTVNGTPLLVWPPTVTTMFPVLAPPGTGATIVVALQLVGSAGTPLNVMTLAP